MVPRQPSEGTLEHFQAYLLLAAIPAAAIKRRGRTRVAILSVACLGMVLEVAQMQIPGRAFEWRGVIANSLGVTVGRLAAPAGRDGGSAARAGAAEPDCPAGATMRPTEPPASGACAEGCVSPASRRPCPRCGSTRVYCSHRRGLLERWLSLVGLKIRRCHACNLRFYALWRFDAFH